MPGPALDDDEAILTEHGGYKCAGCLKVWISLSSLNLNWAHIKNRGTVCEDEDSSRELRNVYLTDLATGVARDWPIFMPGNTVTQQI